MDEQPKPGWQTTEFWGSFAGYLGGAAALLGYLPQENVDPLVKGITMIAGGVIMVGSVAGYAISRGLAKLRR